MKRYANFTLMELLVVIGIIVLLAGLIMPAVMSAQQKGRITQAKADMSSIMTALKGVESTYNRMVNPEEAPFEDSGDKENLKEEGKVVGIRFGGKSNNGQPSDDKYNSYDKFIIILTDPKYASDNSFLNINKRRIKFLDPKPKYDPSSNAKIKENKKHLWLDPWGNQYVILINTDFSDKIPHPNENTTLSAKALIYSFGPNGKEDYAQNILYDTEIKKLNEAEKKNADDVTSWN